MPRRHYKTYRSPLHADDSPPEELSRSRLDEWFLPGRHQALRQRSSPFLPEMHDELTKSWQAPTRLTSVLLLQLLSPPLTVLKKRDMSTCLLWMSLWLHISARPQLSDVRRGLFIRPSLFGPAVEGFAECFTEAQKLSQAM